MASQRAEQAQAGRELDFFGAVTASATHEIKNHLAVINEQSNLILEILDMTHQGHPPDLEHLQDLSNRVVARVAQADQVVRRLNAFAHSAEAKRDRSELSQALELMVLFYGRLAALKGVTLEREPGPASEGVQIKARPIVLQQVIWAALQSVVAAARGGRVRVGVEVRENSIHLRLAGELDSAPQAPPAELLAPLAAHARAEENALHLEIPRNPQPAD